jgi:glycosyltransferase involved in cell wall biosynthesis
MTTSSHPKDEQRSDPEHAARAEIKVEADAVGGVLDPGHVPLVSVVIPTHNRPHLVVRAVESALAQTLASIEVIVVVDGPDPATRTALAAIADRRLSIRNMAARTGACAARNRGIEAAHAKWVALLDDDDRWEPRKLEVQLRAAERAAVRYPIVCCKVMITTPGSCYVAPGRLPLPDEPVGDYLLLRKGFFYSERLIQTSMILAPRELFLAVPFTEGLPRHHETDWLLRCSTVQGTGIVFVDDVLTTWYTEENRPHIGAQVDWRSSVRWALDNRHLMGERAFAAFVMIIVSSIAARKGDWRAFWTLLRVTRKYGRPTPVEYVLFLGMWLVPQKYRWMIRNNVLKLRGRIVDPATRPAREPEHCPAGCSGVSY